MLSVSVYAAMFVSSGLGSFSDKRFVSKQSVVSKHSVEPSGVAKVFKKKLKPGVLGNFRGDG